MYLVLWHVPSQFQVMCRVNFKSCAFYSSCMYYVYTMCFKLQSIQHDLYISFAVCVHLIVLSSFASPNITLSGCNKLDVGLGLVQQVFYYTEKIGSNKLVVWKKLVSTELALCLLQQLEYLYPNLKQIVESNCPTRYFGAK